MTLFFQLDCVRQSSVENPKERGYINVQGLSTYLTPIGHKCNQEPFRAKLSGAELSRLRLSVQKENRFLAKARLEMLESILEKQRAQDMGKQGEGMDVGKKEAAVQVAQFSQKSAMGKYQCLCIPFRLETPNAPALKTPNLLVIW